MKTIIYYSALILGLSLILLSCQEEKIEESTAPILTDEIIQAAMSPEKPNWKRHRIKVRPRINFKYRVVSVVDENTDNPTGAEVTEVETTIYALGGVMPNLATMQLELKGITNKGYKRFVYNQLEFNGGEPVGMPFIMSSISKDANGNTIGQPDITYVTVEDDSDLQMKTPSLFINTDGETFTCRMVVKGTNRGDVENIHVRLIPRDGGAEADPESFMLSLKKETDTKRIFRNTGLTFGDFDNVVDMEYDVEVALLDIGGEELDYAEFIIVGEEN